MANNKISLFFKSLLLGIFISGFGVNGHAATLPAGYTELEYIESTGTQYIDTGITGFNTGNWEIYAKWLLPVATQTNSYANVFSAYSSENHNSYRIITKLTDSSAYYVSGNSKAGGGSVALDNKAINQIHTATARNGSVIFDGETINTPTQGTALPSDVNLGIFARGDASAKIVARIYSVNVKKDGVLIGDFVPAKNSSGVIGMYDTVSGNFFTNAGTGTFIAGPEVGIRIATTAYNSARFNPVVTELNDTIATIRSVVTNTINQTKAIADLQATKQTRPNENCPAGKKCLLVEDNDGQPHWYEIIENAYGLPNGYTALEYIENTDNQYINTGITVNSGTTVIATFQGTDDDRGAVFGYDQDYTGTMMQCYNGKWRVNNTTTDLPCTTKATVDITWTDDTSGRHVSTATINGITVPTYTNSRTYKTLMLFQGNGWDNADNYWTGGKIYSLSITQNNTLVRNFVPAKRNSDGVIGMYDLANDVFYTNAGSGTFDAGPEI